MKRRMDAQWRGGRRGGLRPCERVSVQCCLLHEAKKHAPVSVSVLECIQSTCLFGPRCTQHSALSKSCALACTRHSVHKLGYASK
jgi:hypothetical protein